MPDNELWSNTPNRCPAPWSVSNPSAVSLFKSNKQLLSAYYLLSKNVYRRLLAEFWSQDEPRPLNSGKQRWFREPWASPKLNFLIRRTWTLVLVSDHMTRQRQQALTANGGSELWVTTLRFIPLLIRVYLCKRCQSSCNTQRRAGPCIHRRLESKTVHPKTDSDKLFQILSSFCSS